MATASRKTKSPEEKWALPAQQARSRATRAKILAAAEQVFADKGYDGARLSDIAEAAGCSVGATYFRFKDKDALFSAIAESFRDEARAGVGRLIENAQGLEPEIVIRTFVTAAAANMSRHKGLFRAIVERGLDHPQAMDTIFKFRDELAASLESVLNAKRSGLKIRVMTQMIYGFLIAGVLNRRAPTRIEDARAIAELGNACVAYFGERIVTLAIDLFWSFRSPYSYLATPRLVEMERDYDLTIHVRPVYPLAVRSGGFFASVNPLWIPYLMRDTFRLSEMLGMPYRWPRPDPVVVDPSTRAATPNQPYIHRLTRLGCAAAEIGRGLPFLLEVSRIIWSGEIVNWHEGDHLALAAARAGVDLAELDAKIAADPDKYEAIIQENQKAHEAAGHWGVPTMVFEGEPFFGQDRLDVLLWRLKRNGLRERRKV